MARRLLASFLSLVMIFSFPVSAYAESNMVGLDGTDTFSYYEFDDVAGSGETCEDCGNDPCTCILGCGECGSIDGHTEGCSQYEAAVVPEVIPCTECGVTDGHAETCSQYVAPVIPEVIPCEECGEVDGHAETCSLYVAPVVPEVLPCTECGVTDGHAETCSLYVAPVVPVEGACTECGVVDGHAETCSLYEVPVVLCPNCGVQEGELHLKGCEEYIPVCSCETDTFIHAEGCDFYQAPVTAEVYTEASGVYSAIDGHCESAPISVEEYNGQTIYILASDEPQNLYFKHRTLLGIGVVYSISDETYAYLNDSDDNTWLFSGKALVTVAADAPADTEVVFTANAGLFGKQTITIKVIEKLPEPELPQGSDQVETEDGNTVAVTGIPENGELRIGEPDGSDVEAIMAFIAEQTDAAYEVEPLFAYDITIVDENGKEWQPGDEPVKVTLTIPDLTMGLYQKLQVAHLHEGEVKMVENVEMDLEKDTISFTTDGFSTYVGSFVDFSNGVKNSIMLIPGTAEPLVDILEAIDPGTYLKYTIPTDVESVSVAPADCGITATTSSVTAAEEFGYGEATLTVNMKAVGDIEATTYTIRVLRGEIIFGLEGAHDNWNSDVHADEEIIIGEENLGTYDVFDKVVYSADSSFAKDDNDVLFGGNYKVYLRPGMAFAFSDSIYLRNPSNDTVMTGWKLDDYKDGKYNFGGWKWIYNQETYKNYLIAQNVTEYTVCRIEIRDDATGTDVRYIELHIIPDNTPELLRTYLGSRTDYTIKEVPVTLFDYDGREWNDHYSNGNTTNVAMGFHSADGGKNALVDDDGKSFTFNWAEGNNGVDSSGRNAKQGIMQSSLVNGLPVMAQGSGVDLFSTTSIGNAKKVHQNVGFEFIYDSDGYYTYNSELNHAQFNSTSNKIELYTQSLSASDSNTITQNWADQNPKAGFYPFANINEAFISVDATGMTVEEKLARLKTGVDENNRLNGDLAKDFVATSKDGSTVGMYFGLSITSDFYLPKDKKLNGRDMIYEFTGDDDLWVFIDGQLVLDIGGGHTPVSGSFNLTTGEVWVEYFSQLDAGHGGYYTSLVSEEELDNVDLLNDAFFVTEENFLKNLEDDQMHTISIFYLERYSGESNCRMRFNLPLVPSNAVHVSKNLVNQEGLELSVTPDVDYTFTLYTAADSDDEIDATNFAPYANKPYTVVGSGASSDTQTTDANGQFTLKDGWTASFPGIPRFTEVKVVELEQNDGYEYAGHTVSVNKAAATDYTLGDYSETKVMQLNQSITFDFVNKMKTQPLTVEKQVVNGTAGLINPEQEFEFTLDFVPEILEKGEGAIKADNSVNLTDGRPFQLGHGESVTIPRVPVNMTFTLKEANPDTDNNSFDAPVFNSTTCTTSATPNAFDTDYAWTMCDGGENKIVVTNQQRFDLTITKHGISGLDHHAAYGTKNNEERQSTIYTIVGKIGDVVISELDVVICGNDSVTVKKLPVGTYTVEEDTNWSWRYNPVGGANKAVMIPSNAQAQVEYTNERPKIRWLSGDCYIENWFALGEIKKRDGSDNVID